MKAIIENDHFFPDLLKSLPIWVLWRLENRNGRLTKVPYQVNGLERASSTDPDSWGLYDEASATFAKYPDRFKGLGTVMSHEYQLIFIDIDHCIDEDGNLDERATDILDAFTDDDGDLTQYIELSQSGTGLHIITIGTIPRCFKNSRLNVEMYCDGRFCAMTGRALSAREPSDCDVGVRYVFERYKTAKQTPSERRQPDTATQHADKWVIDHAKRRDGSKFSALFAGDASGYESHSEADLALCKILAFWTNNCADAIDRIFRQSGLYRAKWERQTYSQTTIQTAIDTNDDTFDEFMQRRIKEEGEASIEMFAQFYD